MAAGGLDVLLAKHVAGLVEMLVVGFKGGVEVVNLLVHKTELEE